MQTMIVADEEQAHLSGGLPKREQLMVDLAKLPELLRRVEELHESKGMLGLRGCRLGIL